MKDDWNTKAKMACQDRAARQQGLGIWNIYLHFFYVSKELYECYDINCYRY